MKKKLFFPLFCINYTYFFLIYIRKVNLSEFPQKPHLCHLTLWALKGGYSFCASVSLSAKWRRCLYLLSRICEHEARYCMLYISSVHLFINMKENTEGWNIKKAEFWRTDVFKLWCWCWRRLLKVPRRSNQSVLKEINPEYSLEGLMLKLKLQYFGHLMWRAHWERPWWWERLRVGGEGGGKWWDGWMALLR